MTPERRKALRERIEESRRDGGSSFWREPLAEALDALDAADCKGTPPADVTRVQMAIPVSRSGAAPTAYLAAFGHAELLDYAVTHAQADVARWTNGGHVVIHTVDLPLPPPLVVVTGGATHPAGAS